MEPNDRLRLVTPVRRPSEAANLNVVVTFADTVAMKCVVNHRSPHSFIKRNALQNLEENLRQKFFKIGEVRVFENGKPILYNKVALDIELQGNIRISQASFLVKRKLKEADAILGTNLLDDLLREISMYPDGAHESGRAN